MQIRKENIKPFGLHKIALIVLAILLTTISTVSYAQVRKPFTHRTSSEAPGEYQGVQNYNLQGDFTMIGNTNMTLVSYSDTQHNNSNMKYVDIDGDTNTINSSSAMLNIDNYECTDIIYAGLYWSGRAHNGGASPDIFTNTKELNKRKVKFKIEGSAYQEVTAGTNDIHFPSIIDDNIYAAYADVTEYVREKGVGNYFVADMALTEGTGGNTGYYGGWGMVVIYKNTNLSWKDISVFDGYALMKPPSGTPIEVELDVDGFTAVQNGPVNLRLGVMAGEGDVNIKNNYFQIQKLDNSWLSLNHGGNDSNNFFNSSIYTGGNTRNPNLLNNTGIDISMFDLPNNDNSIIDNNDNAVKFRYGSNQDIYSIFSIVFAVDAYVPAVIAENNANEYNGVTPFDNGTVEPGQELEFDLDIFNKGTEGVVNATVEVQVPYNLHYIGSDIIDTAGANYGPVLIPSGTQAVWSHPSGATDPSTTPGGVLTWYIGDIINSNQDNPQGSLKYRFKVSDNCTLLLSTVGDCGLDVGINGTITAEGKYSNLEMKSKFIKGYEVFPCEGRPIYDDFKTTISISDDFRNNCAPPIEVGARQFKAFCEAPGFSFDRETITNEYPIGTKFFTEIPEEGYNSTAGLVTGGFSVSGSNGAKKLYYVVSPDMLTGCYMLLETSLTNVNSQPAANDVFFCYGESVVLDVELSQEGIDNGYELVYYDKNDVVLIDAPEPTEVGTYSYKVAEKATQGTLECVGDKTVFTVTIGEGPEVQYFEDVNMCENSDVRIELETFNPSYTYTWEYKMNETATTWNVIDNSSLTGVSVSGNNLTISHASLSLNGVVGRLIVAESNGGCESISNEFIIQVGDCGAITNPMMPNKTKQN
ncbi:hypothetical protein ACFFU1_14620 [Algibacter miyuki]|uniref:DUF11 domain-containing protein n=1 Tax=Algibacter miyuki TaxID=1306933 RepID=A0ABV5H357_9FLAO|nr:hypothetical protein [Algibacter miyuki]MDN3664547.1 hypothetical protein [Algibacter miyuki]